MVELPDAIGVLMMGGDIGLIDANPIIPATRNTKLRISKITTRAKAALVAPLLEFLNRRNGSCLSLKSFFHLRASKNHEKLQDRKSWKSISAKRRAR